jgi:hypothetical protein
VRLRGGMQKRLIATMITFSLQAREAYVRRLN